MKSPALRAVYDPANYVFCGYDPWKAGSRRRSARRTSTSRTGKPGRSTVAWPARARAGFPRCWPRRDDAGYDGFATMEPHLLGGGPTGGVTGPELFPKAVAAFKGILDRIGATYR